jgi:glycosyltransferase involved in cell wall biosynthesis
LGWVSDSEKWAIYQKADLLILPSYEEGLPYVIIEAMASGLPIISTPVGGIPEVIKEGINGFLINPGDYEALANRIIQLVQNKELRLTIGHKNQEDAKNKYAQEQIFLNLENIYNHLMEKS